MSDEEKPRFPLDDLKVDFGQIVKTASDPKRIADFRRQEDEHRERQMRERAERARQEALAQFTAMPAEARWEAYLCPSCSAIVESREKHLDWHGALAETAAAAHEAAWRGRPIG